MSDERLTERRATAAQRRLWLLAQAEPQSLHAVLWTAVQLRGPMDLAALQQAITDLFADYPVLRTVLRLRAGTLYQVRASEPPALEQRRVRLAKVSASALAALARRAACRSFSLEGGPLVRVSVLTLGGSKYLLVLSAHRAIVDDRSLSLLRGALLARLRREPRPTGEAPDYFDVVPEVVGAGDRAAAFWQSQLAQMPRLSLAPDRPPASRDGATRIAIRVSRETLARLAKLARSAAATEADAVLAAFVALLHRYTDARDIAIAIWLPRRPPAHEWVVGPLASEVALRVQIGEDDSLRSLLQRVLAARASASAHVLGPGEALFEETERREPVHLQFGFEDAQDPDVTTPLTRLCRTQTALIAGDYEVLVARDRSGRLELRYSTVSLDATTASRIASHYAVLLRGLSAAPDAPIDAVPLVTRAEEAAARNEWRARARPTSNELLHSGFSYEAAHRPDAVAIAWRGGQLTYGELHERAAALASVLATRVSPSDLVGVHLERGPVQVLAVLAISMLGAAYVPLEISLPGARLADILRRADCRVILTEHPRDEFSGRICVDPAAAYPPSREVLRRKTTADAVAYVIFTSGSTGEPKGVMISHRGAMNTILDVNERFGIQRGDKVAAVSSLAFDLSVWDIFGTLAAGATIVEAPGLDGRDAEGWLALVAEAGVTVWNSVPALMQMLVAAAESANGSLSSLRLVLLSGDWIPLDLPDRVRARAPRATVVSLGGATEASIWSVFHRIARVERHWRSIPYGRSLANQQLLVLNARGQLCPVGVAGELYIGGAGVALGYLGDPLRTTERFVREQRIGKRLYRTGDLARYFADGAVEFLGRLDNQVKVRGFRIELGEIEAVLRTHPLVRDAVVLARGDPAGDRQLVAYVMTHSGDLTPQDARAFVAERLPAYMVPTAVISLEEFPLGSNGKVDRARLPLPAPDDFEHAAAFVAPRNETEAALARLFAAALGLDAVSVTDDFFDLGGHSLLATQLVARIQDALGIRVPLRTFLEHPTVGALAAVSVTNV